MWPDYLVFCGGVFSLSALWWRRIRGLWRLPDGRDWLGGLWVFFLWVGQYSVNLFSTFRLMSRAVFPPHCLAWGQTMVGIMVTSFTRIYASTVAFSTPDLAAGHCQQTPLPETPGHSQASLLWGHWSFLLCPGAHKVLFVPSKSLFPQSCGSSVIKSHWPPKSNSLGVLSPFAGSPGWEICCGP